MADSMTEARWLSDGLGHNGKRAQINEFKRRIVWLEGGHRDRLERELNAIPLKVAELKEKIREAECRKDR